MAAFRPRRGTIFGPGRSVEHQPGRGVPPVPATLRCGFAGDRPAVVYSSNKPRIPEARLPPIGRGRRRRARLRGGDAGQGTAPKSITPGWRAFSKARGSVSSRVDNGVNGGGPFCLDAGQRATGRYTSTTFARRDHDYRVPENIRISFRPSGLISGRKNCLSSRCDGRAVMFLFFCAAHFAIQVEEAGLRPRNAALRHPVGCAAVNRRGVPTPIGAPKLLIELMGEGSLWTLFSQVNGRPRDSDALWSDFLVSFARAEQRRLQRF